MPRLACRSTFERLAARLLLVGVLLGASGCSSLGLGYLIQAGRGQMALQNHARPIPEVLRDETVPPRIRQLLARIPDVKAWGEGQGLKATRNYSEYVQLDRLAAVWVVSASEALRFKPRTWSFPIVGSFTYLGWFDVEEARRYASELRSQGWDVDVRGARAYSTLGWFKDAVLSTMIPEGPDAWGELAEVVLHESVHATVYVPNQSTFNESLAQFVAEQLTPVFLAESRGADSPELQAYRQSLVEGRRRGAELRAVYESLDRLYREPGVTEPDKQERKQRILAQARTRLGLKRDLNNASLIQFRTYGSGQKEFEALLKVCGGDWRRFLARVGSLKAQDFGGPQSEDLEGVVSRAAREGC